MASIMCKSLRTLIVGLSILSGTFANGQEVVFRHYSSDQGFTGAAFKSMIQDSLGFLWITSGSGLFKFDGYNFTNYQSAISGSRQLLHGSGARNIITDIDPSGKIWIAFGNSVAWFDRDKDLFMPFKVTEGNTNPDLVWPENDKTIWLGIAGRGLVRFDAENEKVSSYVNQTQEDDKFMDDNTVLNIADHGNSLFLGTKNGLWILNKENYVFSRPRCPNDECNAVLSGQIKKIFIHSNHIWLWKDNELVKVNTDYTVIERLALNEIQQQFDFERRFVDARVMHIAEDHEGKFWIASQGLGLTYYDPQQNILKNYRNDKNDLNSLPSDVLNHVMIDRDKNVWATTVNKGFVQLKKQSIVFYNYLDGISSTGVDVLDTEGSSQLVAGTNGSGVWISKYERGRSRT